MAKKQLNYTIATSRKSQALVREDAKHIVSHKGVIVASANEKLVIKETGTTWVLCNRARDLQVRKFSKASYDIVTE